MKCRRIVSLLLSAVMLMILSLSAMAYPHATILPGGLPDPMAKARHDFTTPFVVTFQNKFIGTVKQPTYEVTGVNEFNQALLSSNMLKNAQPGDQFCFTLIVKNRMEMPRPNSFTPVAITPTIRCVVPEIPALGYYFVSYDYNIFAAGAGEAQLADPSGVLTPLGIFRNPITGAAYNPNLYKQYNISGSAEAMEMAAFDYAGGVLDDTKLTYNRNIFVNDPAAPDYAAGDITGGKKMSIGTIPANGERVVHVWFQFVGHRPQTSANPAENARLLANHNWLMQNHNKWMNTNARLSWYLDAYVEVDPVGYTIYHKDLATGADLKPPDHVLGIKDNLPTEQGARDDPDGTLGTYPGDIIPYTPEFTTPADKDYVAGYDFHSIDPSSGDLILKPDPADNIITLYYDKKTDPPQPTYVPYALRFMTDTGVLLEYREGFYDTNNIFHSFRGIAGSQLPYSHIPETDSYDPSNPKPRTSQFDGWTFTGVYVPGSTITLQAGGIILTDPTQNVITLIYTRTDPGQTGYIIKYQDVDGNPLRDRDGHEERRIPNAGSVGDILTYVYNNYTDFIEGYAYQYSIPGNGTITLLPDMENNVIILVYAQVITEPPTSHPLDEPSGGSSGGGLETIDPSKGPTDMPVTGGFNWADLFFVGCGLATVGLLYLFGARRRKKDEEEVENAQSGS